MAEAAGHRIPRHQTTPAEDTHELTSRLQGQVVVVTGGSRGLGQAITQAFAAHEAQVIVASRTRPDLPAGAHQPIAWIQVDVTDVASMRALARHLHDTHGTVSYLGRDRAGGGIARANAS